MNYEEMSDFEINKAVAEALGMITDGGDETGGDETGVCCGKTGAGDLEFRDYCNNPSDAWLIIFYNTISLDITDTHTAAISGDNHCYIHTNPLRAAMIVFLMMQEK